MQAECGSRWLRTGVTLTCCILIKANAVLRQHQREKEEIGGIFGVIAVANDFYEAIRLFEALNEETGGQVTKLTKKEYSSRRSGSSGRTSSRSPNYSG